MTQTNIPAVSEDEQRALMAEFKAVELQRRAEAAEARVAELERGWQPIETAPHNASVLLGWRDWRDGHWIMGVGAASMGERLGNSNSNRSKHSSATHWMPLPAPPAPTPSTASGGE